MPLHLNALEPAHGHLAGLRRTLSTAPLRRSLFTRPNSHVGHLAQQLIEYIGYPGNLTDFQPPYIERASLLSWEHIPKLGTKTEVPKLIARQLAKEFVGTCPHDHPHVSQTWQWRHVTALLLLRISAHHSESKQQHD